MSVIMEETGRNPCVYLGRQEITPAMRMEAKAAMQRMNVKFGLKKKQ